MQQMAKSMLPEKFSGTKFLKSTILSSIFSELACGQINELFTKAILTNSKYERLVFF